MSEDKKILQFDPDMFVLKKEDFLRILDNIGERWKKNKTDNWKLLAELAGAKFYFRMKSEDSIRELWGEIVNEINEIMLQNSLEIGKQNNETWVETFEKIKNHKKENKNE